MEVVHADDSSEVLLADMNAWDAEGQEPISGIALADCDRIEATKNGLRLVFSTEAARLQRPVPATGSKR